MVPGAHCERAEATKEERTDQRHTSEAFESRRAARVQALHAVTQRIRAEAAYIMALGTSPIALVVSTSDRVAVSPNATFLGLYGAQTRVVTDGG